MRMLFSDSKTDLAGDAGDSLGREDSTGSEQRSSFLIDKRAEQRLRDKLARQHKNMADLRRKLVEQDKRERARRKKVRAKRQALTRSSYASMFKS